MLNLTSAFVEGVNICVCEQLNQQSYVLNPDVLSSAVGCIYQPYDSDCEKAAAVFRSLILNHPFGDGNKRTAVLTLFALFPPNISDMELGELAIKVATGELKNTTELASILYSR